MRSKQELRKHIALEKRKYDSCALNNWSEQILSKLEQEPSFRSSQTILMYYSLKDEVQTDAFIEKWYQQKNILLPVVQGEDLILRQYTGKESLQTGAYHIEEPVGEVFSSYQKIDAVIVPGVAFDKKGNRLGRGKGYYDRLLPQLKATKIGICFPFQLVEEVPTEPFDIKMDKIITI